jgi:putative hydrolase of the HAD superfamily
MVAIGFDLGHTLVSYGDVPLSWKSLYKQALEDVLLECKIQMNDNKILCGEEILSKYNTRITPREIEISSDIIFSEILLSWGVSVDDYLKISKQRFFQYFQRNSELYDDTLITLQTLRMKGIRTGVLTDVSYGMDREFVLNDILKFDNLIDVLLTSVEVGYRKPNTRGFIELSERLGTNPRDMLYVGDEPKDVEGANNSGMYSVFIDRIDSKADYGQKETIRSLKDLLEFI